jgi:endonuclease YncB( thermonuclease family)
MKPLLSKPHREKEKELAVLARDRLEALLTRTECVRIECGEFDKYGRILVVVYSHNLREEDKQSINDRMLEEGHGVPL